MQDLNPDKNLNQSNVDLNRIYSYLKYLNVISYMKKKIFEDLTIKRITENLTPIDKFKKNRIYTFH